MRLDKFLKVSRLIKRRTIAKEVCAKGRVKINDVVAKPSSEVSIGDIITIGYGNKLVQVKITRIQESSRKEEALSMYEIVSEERI